MSKVKVTGNTFNCKDLLKAAGGKWDAESKTWELDAAAWQSIVATNPPSLSAGCTGMNSKIYLRRKWPQLHLTNAVYVILTSSIASMGLFIDRRININYQNIVD